MLSRDPSRASTSASGHLRASTTRAVGFEFRLGAAVLLLAALPPAPARAQDSGPRPATVGASDSTPPRRYGLRNFLRDVLEAAARRNAAPATGVEGSAVSAVPPPPRLSNEERLAVRAAARRHSVRVDAQLTEGRLKRGSGFVVWRSGATAVVLTNAHVVQDSAGQTARRAAVSGPSGGRAVPAHVIAAREDRSAGIDYAFLAVQDSAEVLGDAVEQAPGVLAGERIVAVGNPLEESFLVDEGTVVRVDPTPSGQVLVHDALVEHGSSGGGVFNLRGQLVGITTYLDERTQLGLALATTPLLSQVRFHRARVAADTGWQDTGILLPAGGHGAVVFATGRWSVGPLAGGTGPAGMGGYTQYSLAPEVGHGALLLTVGPNGPVMAVDRWWRTADPGPAFARLEAPRATGTLRFRINDRETANNGGALVVTVLELR